MEQKKVINTVKFYGLFAIFTLSLIFGCYTPPKDDTLILSAWNLSTKRKYDECISESNKALAFMKKLL